MGFSSLPFHFHISITTFLSMQLTYNWGCQIGVDNLHFDPNHCAVNYNKSVTVLAGKCDSYDVTSPLYPQWIYTVVAWTTSDSVKCECVSIKHCLWHITWYTAICQKICSQSLSISFNVSSGSHSDHENCSITCSLCSIYPFSLNLQTVKYYFKP